MLQNVIYNQKSFKISKINGIEKHGFGVRLRQIQTPLRGKAEVSQGQHRGVEVYPRKRCLGENWPEFAKITRMTRKTMPKRCIVTGSRLGDSHRGCLIKLYCPRRGLPRSSATILIDLVCLSDVVRKSSSNYRMASAPASNADTIRCFVKRIWRGSCKKDL